MAELPKALYDALTRIAEGEGRTPTFAHPDCRCGKPYLPSCPCCGAKPNRPCTNADLVTTCIKVRPKTRPGTRRDCPIHRGRR